MEELKRLANILVEEILDEPENERCSPYNSEQMPPASGPSLELTPTTEKPPSINGPENGSSTNGKKWPSGKKRGKKPWKKAWCPLPNPAIPVMKSELRGGVHYPKCECVKRNGLQDSCMSYSCWVVFNNEGCASTPWASCPLAKQQLEKYGALANQCPIDKPQPHCGVCVEELNAKQFLQRQKERRCALGGRPGFDDDDCSNETALGSGLSLRLEVVCAFVNTVRDVMHRRTAGWRSHHPPPPPNSSPPLSASAPPRPRAQNQRDSNHNRSDEGGTSDRHRYGRTGAPTPHRGRSSIAPSQPPPPPPLPSPRGLYLSAELRLGPVVLRAREQGQRAREQGRPLVRRWVPAGPWVSTVPGDDLQGALASAPGTPPTDPQTPNEDQDAAPVRARGVFTLSRSRHERSRVNSGFILEASPSQTTVAHRVRRPVRKKRVPRACRKQSLTDVSIGSEGKKKAKSCTKVNLACDAQMGWPGVYHSRCISSPAPPYIKTIFRKRSLMKQPAPRKWARRVEVYENPWVVLRRRFELSKPCRRPWSNAVASEDSKQAGCRRTLDSGWVPGLCLRCLQPIVTYR